MKKRINWAFILVFIVVFILSVKFNIGEGKSESESKSKVISMAILKNQVTGSEKKLTVIAVGDIMFHIPQIKNAYNGKTYDFRSVFEEIKPELESADISMGNFEAVISPSLKFSGFPKFNVPAQTLEGIKYSGIDLLSEANNHIMDKGQSGLNSTTKLIKQNGMICVGAGQKDNKKYAIINKNGIRLGVLAYTFGTNYEIASRNTLNYIDKLNIKKDIENIKKESDFIIVYLHSGTEYVRDIEDKQRKLYHLIADMGADCILNSHPHVARQSEIYKSNGRDVFINYSMGNFLSNQNDKYTDIGLMIKLSIIKNGNITKLDAHEIMPTYRLRYKIGNKVGYRIVLCDEIDNYKDKLGINDIAYVKDIDNKFRLPMEVSVFNTNKK